MFEKYLKVFTEYIDNNYDLNVKNILLKKKHSIRVAKLMYDLAINMGLDERDILLAYKIGLCHDLGRFREIKLNNGRFDDLNFDHGACSNTILFNEGLSSKFDFKKDELVIVRKSLYYHNKRDIGFDLNDRELLFVNMIRDCDKIDIINLQAERKKFDFIEVPNEIVTNNFFNESTTDIRDAHTKSDWALLYFGFIRNMSYQESFDLLESLGYIDNFINSLKVSDKNIELFNRIVSTIKSRKILRRGVYNGNER